MADKPATNKKPVFITYTPTPGNAHNELGALAILPPELRRHIYTYFLPCLYSPLSATPRTFTPSDPLALLRTSRRIHEEVTALLYANRTLIFSINTATRTALHLRLEHTESKHAIVFPPSRWSRPRWIAANVSDWLSPPVYRRMPFERLRGVVVEIEQGAADDLEWTLITYIGMGMVRKFLACHPERLHIAVVARTAEADSGWSVESKLLAEFPEYVGLPGGDLFMALAPLLFGLEACVDVHAAPAVAVPLMVPGIRKAVKSMEESDEECLVAGGTVLRIVTDRTALTKDQFMGDRSTLDSRVEETMWRCCDEVIWGPYGRTLRNSWSMGHGVRATLPPSS